jgi:hypothetical protein
MLHNNKIKFSIKDKNKSTFYLNGNIFDCVNKILKEEKVFDPIASTKLDCLCAGFFFNKKEDDNTINIYACPILKNNYGRDDFDSTYVLLADVYPTYPIQIFDKDSFTPMIEFKQKLGSIDSYGNTLEEALLKHNKTYNVSAECFYIAYKEFSNDNTIIENFIPNSLLELGA